ncbi:MAG: S41 family peptidase [Verrucomicrobia bacterium]|nr:S41 family peptidase [Verrucomicrobiota bacterium]
MLRYVRWICVACLVGGVCIRVDASADTSETNTTDDAYAQMELLTEVLMQVKKYYVEERSYGELIEGALKGMLHALDPHSAFLDGDEYADMKDDTRGEYGGIGIHIGMRDGTLTVISPIEDTPGFRAGLQSGDKIVAIDAEKTMGISMREAVNQLRGPKGEKVVLSILSEGDSEPRDIEVIRDVIEVPCVKGTRMIRDGIGYVRITQFAKPTTEKLHEALKELEAEGMEALVLDLRGNPGGLLKESIRVAETFLKRGTLIVSTRGREGVTKTVEYKAVGSLRYLDIPVAVLINGGSASASEIVAGALQDHRRAVLVGQTSFGKGSVQSVIGSRSDGRSAVRLTTAHYYTPSDRLIHEIGIDPDLPVYLGREEWRKVQIRRAQLENPDLYKDEEKDEFADVVDRQLGRAVDLLQAVMIFEKRR